MRAQLFLSLMALTLITLGCDPSKARNKTPVETSTTERAQARAATPKDDSGESSPMANKSSFEEALASYPPPSERLSLTPAEWKSRLSEQEYYVLREKGTERPGTGDLLTHKGHGIYTCRGCGAPLFASTTKYKSGTGWPSFWEPIQKGRVAEETDDTLGMRRTEVLCARCDGHLGHVFSDGPDPTGLRYCINSAALDFVDVEK